MVLKALSLDISLSFTYYTLVYLLEQRPVSKTAPWRKRLDARLPPLGSRVSVSVTPCGFRGRRNRIREVFSQGFSRFHVPQISFHHFSSLLSFISFHPLPSRDGVTDVVGRYPCYSQTINKKGLIASHHSTRYCVEHVLMIFT